MKLFDWCIKNLCGRKERVKSLKAVDLDVYMLFDKQTHAVTHQKWKIQMIHLIMCPPVRIKLHMEWNFWWMHSIFLCAGGKEREKSEVVDLDGYDICFVCEQNVLVDRVFIDISIIMC